MWTNKGKNNVYFVPVSEYKQELQLVEMVYQDHRL